MGQISDCVDIQNFVILAILHRHPREGGDPVSPCVSLTILTKNAIIYGEANSI